jgi:tetratricopeptide (TPR) repeat protein
MVSERMQRQIDSLLDAAESAIPEMAWDKVAEAARAVLSIHPANADALAFITMVEAATGGEPEPSVASIDPAPRPPDSIDTPTSFAGGRYEVSKFLGEGGKKRVYQAHDTLLDREVAFALIKTEGFDQTSKERISREAQAMGRLGVHPNIVAVLDLGEEDDGSPYMVTELMGGGDIEGVLEEAEENRLSLERTIEIGKAVCEGLEFAHARGIVHRDLKPGNVWLTEAGTAKIGDFGLAVMTDRSRLTREGMMVGTVSYMPPEQATGGDITPKADLYSLGAMLYEMVTGRPPFLGDDEIAIIGQHINTPPVAPTWHNGTCPRPLEALIMRMLAKDPAERPDSAQDVFNALNAIDLAARGETVEREANSLESLAGGVFVGRQAEMDQLKGALEDVLGGRGRLVTLVGEPGIGKTRTCEELATYAGLRGAKVLWGRCYEGGGAPPYWPWVQAIRSYVRDIDPDELRRQMGSAASVIAEIVTDVKDRLPELQPPPPIDDPDSARFRLFDSITSFLRTASQAQPLVIVLDDLHWSDQPSLTFLEFIARELNQSRVMLLCTYRDMELNRRHQLTVTLGDLARDRLYERVLLRGLTETDIARFVEIAAGFVAPRELSATVHRHTEGNPLFVTEVIRDLVQSGELTEEKVSGRSSWSVRIPEGVREVIGRRLDRLSDRANEIFTTAAVVGRDFTLTALRELAEDTTEGQLLDVLDEALDARLIEELPDEIGHYQFTHALIQETLTSELSSARKVRLHARIAETLEHVYGDHADEHAAELVPHFVEAELVLGNERSVHYSMLAGEQALEMIAPVQALTHFEYALANIGSEATDLLRARLNYGMGLTQNSLAINTTSGRAAVEYLLAAFEYYESVGDLEKVEKIALNDVLRRGGPGEYPGIREMSSAIDMLGADVAASGRIRSSLAWRKALIGDLEAANAELSKALAISQALGDVGIEIGVLISRYPIAAAELTRDSLVDAIEALDKALELLRSAPDPKQEASAHHFRALASLRMGWLDDASQHGKAGYDAAQKIGNWTGMATTSSYGYHAAAARGRWVEANDWAKLQEPLSLKIRMGAYGLSQHMLDRETRNPVKDVELFRELIPTDSNFDVLSDAAILGNLAEMCHAFPAIDIESDLRAALEAKSDLFAQWFSHPLFGGRVSATVGMLAVVLNDIDGAREPYRRLIRMSSLEQGMSTDRIAGLIALMLDDETSAVGHFEDALSFCRENGCTVQLAWTCSDYSEMLLDRADGASSASEIADREKAIELQDEALAITQELGMRPLTERILARREILRA